MKTFQLVSNQGRLRIHVMTGWFVLAMSVIGGYTSWVHSMSPMPVHPVVLAITLSLILVRAGIGSYQDLARLLGCLRSRIASWLPHRWMRLPQGVQEFLSAADHLVGFVRVRLYSVFCVYRA